MLSTSVAIIEGHHVRYAHPGDGEPVILCHGYPENLQIWSSVGLHLALRRKVVAFDWPGLGRSDRWEGDASPEAMANRLLRMMDHWDIECPTLVATDSGVLPVLMLAARHPERVKRVVVMNAMLDPHGPLSPQVRWLQNPTINKLALNFLSDRVFNSYEKASLPTGVKLSSRVRADIWDCYKRKSVRRYISDLIGDFSIGLERLPGFLPQIEAPLLILWGKDDVHYPAHHAEILQAAVKHAETRLIDGGFHWMAYHKSAELAEIILAFSNEGGR